MFVDVTLTSTNNIYIYIVAFPSISYEYEDSSQDVLLPSLFYGLIRIELSLLASKKDQKALNYYLQGLQVWSQQILLNLTYYC